MPGTRFFSLRTIVINNARRTRHAVNGGMDQSAEFIDKAVAEKRPVDDAALSRRSLLTPKIVVNCLIASGRSCPVGPAKT